MFELCATNYVQIYPCLGMISNPRYVILGVRGQERGYEMAKKIYEVEFRGQKEKFYFDSKKQAEDYAAIVGGFGSKQFRIQAIFVVEEDK